MLHDELMDLIMDHYEKPRNLGKIVSPDVEQTGGNQGCGDKITVHLKINENKIEDMKFEIEGCILSQAGASLISEFIKGKSMEEIKEIDSDKMKELLSKDIVIRRPRCANLGLDTIKVAVMNYEKKSRKLLLETES